MWGPRARDILAVGRPPPTSRNDGFAFGTCREIELGGATVLASRISYVGELGWELYAPIELGARVWDTLWEAGRPAGLVPVGIGVYGDDRPAGEGLPRLRRRAGRPTTTWSRPG